MAGQRPRLPERLPRLTSRQEEVLELIARGLTNFEIAEHLGISLEGAKYHVREIMARLGAASREEAVETWRRRRSSQRTPASWARRAFAAVGLRGIAAGGAAAVGVAGAALVAAVFINGGSGPPTVAPDETPAATAPTSAGTGTLTGEQLTPSPGATGTAAGTPATTTVVPSASASPATASPTPTPPAVGPYPLGTRTGDPVIDAVVAAVEAGDADALFELIHYTPIECDNPNMGQVQPPGTFQCPGDEPDGTEIPAVFSTNGGVHPEGDPLIPDLIDSFLEPFGTGAFDARIHAVLDGDPGLEPGQRGIVFAGGEMLVVDAEGVTAFLFHATNRPENRIANATSFVLPPLPGDPAVFAQAVRAELQSLADAATLTEEQASGYGIFDAWEDHGFTIVAGDQVPVGRGQVSATAVDLPPDTGGGYTVGIYFAVADDGGNCAAGFIAIALPEDDPSAGFVTFGGPEAPAGRPCTAESVMQD